MSDHEEHDEIHTMFWIGDVGVACGSARQRRAMEAEFAAALRSAEESAAAQERARCRAVAQHEMDSVANESPEAAACEAIIRGIQDGDDPRYFVPTCEDVEALREEIAELRAQLHDDPDVKAARESAARRCAVLEGLLASPYGLVCGMDGEGPEWVEQGGDWIEAVDAYWTHFHGSPFSEPKGAIFDAEQMEAAIRKAVTG